MSEILQGDFLIDGRMMDDARRTSVSAIHDLVLRAASTLARDLAAKVSKDVTDGRMPSDVTTRMRVQFGPEEVMTGASNYHTHTLQHDREFHAMMDRRMPDWRGMPYQWQRNQAKAWNFSKLYRGGLDAFMRKYCAVPEHPNCRCVVTPITTKEKIMKPKFFVGLTPASLSAFSTEKEAIDHAKAQVEATGQEQTVFKAIRRVRRKPQPIVVEKA